LVVILSGLCCEVQLLQVGGPGPVQRLAGPPGVEPDEVDGGGCGVVFQAGFAQAEVAGAADAGDVGGLGDGALDPGADPVPVWVPRTSSSSRDQAIFADQATGTSLPSDVVLLKIDRFG
jgi:hypothetical protein